MNKTIDCLMLKTTDERKFFTHKDNFPQLIEFAKTCKAEISVVKANNVKVMELPELAKSICNHGTQSDLPQYEVVEVKLPEVANPRKKLLEHANIIYSYVKDNFLQQKIVSLSDLETEFKDFGLSKAALCNHIARVRTELTDKGYSITKVKRGQYRVTNAVE